MRTKQFMTITIIKKRLESEYESFICHCHLPATVKAEILRSRNIKAFWMSKQHIHQSDVAIQSLNRPSNHQGFRAPDSMLGHITTLRLCSSVHCDSAFRADLSSRLYIPIPNNGLRHTPLISPSQRFP